MHRIYCGCPDQHADLTEFTIYEYTRHVNTLRYASYNRHSSRRAFYIDSGLQKTLASGVASLMGQAEFIESNSTFCSL